MGSGALESRKCDYCNKLPSDYYCRKKVKGTGILIEDQDGEICGKVLCTVCQMEWGNPEDFANCCNEHQL